MCAFLAGCGAPEPECSAEECDELCDQVEIPPAEPQIERWSAFESELVADLLIEVNEGVQLADPDGLGLCVGALRCEDFLGRDVPELPAGELMIRALLRVPQAGERGTWRVSYSSTCEVFDGDAMVNTRTTERTYDVMWGGPSRPFRIDPLQRITSPDPEGRVACTYSLTSLGEPPTTWSGSWGVPRE